MSTYREITTQVADQLVEALKTAEGAVSKVSDSAKRVTDAVPAPAAPFADTFAKLQESITSRLPQPSEIVEANFEFTSRLLAAQRDLTLTLLNAGATVVERPAPKKTPASKASSKS